MPNETNCKLLDFFEKQLERTNYWLSFAEAKNAALLAFNIAIIAFVGEFQELFPIFSTTIMIIFVVSCLVCLSSFFPQTENRPKQNEEDREADNLIFWDDIANVKNEGRYIELVIARYFPGATLEGGDGKMCIDFASEIVINSRIAKFKYGRFKDALRIDMLAIVLCVLLFIAA